LAIAKAIISGDFHGALFTDGTPICKLIQSLSSKSTAGRGLDEILDVKEGVEETLLDSSSIDTHLAVLLAGVASLLVFVQSNWTGPVIEKPNKIVRSFPFAQLARSLMLCSSFLP